MKKNIKKVIYVYTDEVSTTQFKIGKADQRKDQVDGITVEEVAKIRISEQATAATRGEFRIVSTFDISHVESSQAVESAIHQNIVKKGYERLTRRLEDKKGNTEWFDFPDLTEGQVVELVKELVEKETGFSGLKVYSPRIYQAYVKGLLLDQVEKGQKVIGAELAPRFGKTLWALDTFKTLVEDLGYQYLLLPAYVLTAHSSFQKELRSFKDFDKMMFISDTDSDFEEKVKANKDKILVIATSLHTPEESLDKFDCIGNLPSDKKVAFVDEADFGAHTDASKKRLDVLDAGLKVLMTGTAIERAVAGYNVQDVIKWSYMDMLLLKDGIHPLLNKLK